MSANTRTRVISQSKAVYVTPTGWTNDGSNWTIEAAQLKGVDTFSFDIDLAGSRQDVREFGQLARVGTVRMTEINPTLSFGYYLAEGGNEVKLGFTESATTGSQCISAFLTEDATKKESNIFVLTAKEGEDANYADDAAYNAATGSHDVIGFGNAFLSSYSINMSVGEIPRADIEMQASNVVFYQDAHTGLLSPSLDLEGNRSEPNAAANISLPRPQASADLSSTLKVLKPHDITITFDDNEGVTSSASNDGIGGQSIGTDNGSTIKAVQSCSIDLPLAREVIDAIGSQIAYAKPLQFPIDVTLSLSALVTEFGAGALEKALTGTAGDRTTTIRVNLKSDTTTEMEFVLVGAVLDSQSFSQGLDDNETVELTFSAQIGGASTSDQGLFMTNLNTSATRPAQASLNHTDSDGQPNA